MEKIKLGVICGGMSTENEVSVVSASYVLSNLNKEKYEIYPVYIDKNGQWWEILDEFKPRKFGEEITKKEKIENEFKYLKNLDVIFPVLHGLYGEDGTIQGLFELLQIPYVGCHVLASSVGMDKVIMKDVFVANDIPCVKYVSFYKNEYNANKNDIILNSEVKLGYPIIVKPANLGSSIGINISQNREELQKNIKIALNFDEKVILEQVVPNLREINCSVLGTIASCETSVLEEPRNWKTFLDFNEKYILGSKDNNKKIIDVKLDKNIEIKVKEMSRKIFTLFGCSGVVRIDYLLNDKTGEVFANEINTIPGSYANYLWTFKYTFSELLDKLISNAESVFLYKNTHTYAYKSSVLVNYKKSSKMAKFK